MVQGGQNLRQHGSGKGKIHSGGLYRNQKQIATAYNLHYYKLLTRTADLQGLHRLQTTNYKDCKRTKRQSTKLSLAAWWPTSGWQILGRDKMFLQQWPFIVLHFRNHAVQYQMLDPKRIVGERPCLKMPFKSSETKEKISFRNFEQPTERNQPFLLEIVAKTRKRERLQRQH